MISPSGMPIGTSTRPVLFTAPARAKTLVPLLFSVPYDANHSAPFRMIGATFANVSTLFKQLGLSHSPFWAGNGGRGRGSPRLPSIDRISAVSSPQTNAPEPMRTSMSKSKPLLKMFSPSRPYSRACLRACSKRFTASGYSARM